jgi:mRNA interferase MazF
MNRGDVVRVRLPEPKQPGREQIGTRPAVLIQPHIDKIPTIIVVPLTKERDALRFPGTFLILKDATNGLDVDSVVLPFQVRAVDRVRLEQQIGTLSQVDLHKLDAQLRKQLGL